MLLVEYRICMPFTVDEYKRGQLYMIARHCHQESDNGEGVEVIKYEPCEDLVNGKGHYTEKRIHLYKRLPYWVQSLVTNLLYIEEKSWNYYPSTITEYSCSFLPKLQIRVETRYEDNTGNTQNAHNISAEELAQRTVDIINIATDDFPEAKYKESEDPQKVTVLKTQPPRGPLNETWATEHKTPVMCAYKIVRTKFEIWGLQTKAESWAQKAIRDILLLAHRQCFCWADEWYDKSYESIVEYERETYGKTNELIKGYSNANNKYSSLNPVTNDKNMADFN